MKENLNEIFKGRILEMKQGLIETFQKGKHEEDNLVTDVAMADALSRLAELVGYLKCCVDVGYFESEKDVKKYAREIFMDAYNTGINITEEIN